MQVVALIMEPDKRVKGFIPLKLGPIRSRTTPREAFRCITAQWFLHGGGFAQKGLGATSEWISGGNEDTVESGAEKGAAMAHSAPVTDQFRINQRPKRKHCLKWAAAEAQYGTSNRPRSQFRMYKRPNGTLSEMDAARAHYGASISPRSRFRMNRRPE